MNYPVCIIVMTMVFFLQDMLEYKSKVRHLKIKFMDGSVKTLQVTNFIEVQMLSMILTLTVGVIHVFISLSNCTMISQSSRQYFSVWPGKFKSLFEWKSFEPKSMIDILLASLSLLFASWAVYIRKNCARGLGASGSTQDRGHSFSQYELTKASEWHFYFFQKGNEILAKRAVITARSSIRQIN